MNIDPNQLNFFAVAQPLCDCDKRAVPITLAFATSSIWYLNLQNMQARTFISTLRALFVDNSLNAQVCVITNMVTGQAIQVPAGNQGYVNMLCPNPAQISFSSQGAVNVPIQLLNYEVDNTFWTV